MDIKKWPLFCFLDSSFINNVEIVYIFRENNALFVTQTDEVFGIGPMATKSLEIKDQKVGLKPIKIPLLCGKKINGFIYGRMDYILAFNEMGEIYIWGNDWDETFDEWKRSLPPPELISPLSEKKVIEVVSGFYHSMVLCENGEVYTWGLNLEGELGLGDNINRERPQKVQVDISNKVVNIACGVSTSLALLENGEVFSWGLNNNGQLGIGNYNNKFLPVKVHVPPNISIKKIICGQSHALAISDQGVLFTWGCNNFGQLGIKNLSNSNYPLRISNLVGRFIDIGAIHYDDISSAISENLKVYMWGKCKDLTVLEPILTHFNSLHEVFLHCSMYHVTYKPLMMNRTEKKSVSETIKKSFNDPTCSDLTIIVENKQIHVHKYILKLRCDYFRAMFQDHWKENNQSVLEINRSYIVYKAYLQFLYSDEVELLNLEDLLELLQLSIEYCNDNLKHRCEQIMTKTMTTENVSTLYATAINLRTKGLEEICLSFALNNISAVMQTDEFLALNKEIMKKLFMEASNHGLFKS